MKAQVLVLLYKTVAYLPTLAIGLVAFYFLEKGLVNLAAILTSCASVLALCAILFSERTNN